MYAKLIFKNAKRSVKDYLIYIVTMTLCVTLFYAFLSISSTHYHPTIGAEYEQEKSLSKKEQAYGFLLHSQGCLNGKLLLLFSQHETIDIVDQKQQKQTNPANCQILVGVGNVRILNKSRIIELMTANRQNEKPLHKSRWMPMICIFYGILLLWMLEVGTVKYHFYFDSRHPLPVKLMYWGNVLFPALTLLWAIAGAVLHRKIGFSRYLCGLLAGAVLTAIPIFSIAELEKAYFLGFDAPTLNQYLLFGVADILFIISAVMYLSNAALLYWKESKVSRKY